MTALLVAHLLCGVVALVGARTLGRRAFVVGGLAPAATIGWLIANRSDIAAGGVATHLDWVPTLGLGLDLRVDAFSALMIVLVSGIGVLVFGYAWSYFGSSPLAGRAAGLLTLFAGSMLGVVVSDHLLTLFVFWELTSITSYLLIGLDDTRAEHRASAQHALLVTGFGGLSMMGGFVMLGQAGGTYRMSELLADPPHGTAVSVALVLVLIGALTKSAQYPFHSWLPGAMVAPTPISAYLHSAAMVKAGVYLVARLAPAFADAATWRPTVVTLGLVTLVAGGARALRPVDLKQLLAFGTISQLGFLMVLFGIGHPAATAAGCAMLLAHALFKAALFMVVGIVDHESGTRDVRWLPVLGRAWRPTIAVAVTCAASMAAVPPLAGFVAKEGAFAALVDGSTGDRIVLGVLVLGSVLTVAYSVRFVAALLRPEAVAPAAADGRVPEPHAPTAGFLGPAALLAGATAVLGVAPFLWNGLVDAAANDLDPAAHSHLALWHGLSLPLLLSAITLTVGASVFGRRRAVEAAMARWAPAADGRDAYERLFQSFLNGAGRMTSVVQSGSLPIYVAVVLVTATAAPFVAMVTGPWWPGLPDLIGRPAHVPIAALLIGAAVATTVARRRFAAALLLGVVGYAMALLFVIQGAPDLALTQFAVETLSVVVFLLVLRALPDRFSDGRAAVGKGPRLAIALLVGTFTTVMAIAAAGSRTAAPVSEKMSELALPEGDGANVVNVILVDIRGLDTLGEITVLLTVGLGVVALTRVGRGPRGREPSPNDSPAPEEVHG